jgi:predicted DNA-binding transcriptional regulator YafY
VASELGIGDHAAAAWLKVESAVPLELRSRLHETARDVHVDFGLPDVEVVSTQLLRGLRDAVRRRRVIAVRLRDADGPRTVATLEPLGLVRSADGWHLVTRGPDGITALRAASIELARATGGQFERDERFDLGRWWERWRRGDPR